MPEPRPPRHSRHTRQLLRETVRSLKTRREPNEDLIRRVEEALAALPHKARELT